MKLSHNPFPNLCLVMENETPVRAVHNGTGIADVGLPLTWDAKDLIFNSDFATNQLSELGWREGDKLLHRSAWKEIPFLGFNFIHKNKG